ncbi:MAG: hypothetical protein V4542_02320 [Pseudomonadota bacterium]
MTFEFAAVLRLAGRIDTINRWMAFAVRWGLLANAVLIAGNAFSRKLLGMASSTMYDVQPHFFAPVVLLMAAFTLQRDEHVRIDIFLMLQMAMVGILAVFPGIASTPPPAATLTDKQVKDALRMSPEPISDPSADPISKK